jgi:hypothetical protein
LSFWCWSQPPSPYSRYCITNTTTSFSFNITNKMMINDPTRTAGFSSLAAYINVSSNLPTQRKTESEQTGLFRSLPV